MYTTTTKTIIEINVAFRTEICGGCPTIYDFTDTEGTKYYFRLRHCCAQLVCETYHTTLISAPMPSFDGVCEWNDFVKWASEHNTIVI